MSRLGAGGAAAGAGAGMELSGCAAPEEEAGAGGGSPAVINCSFESRESRSDVAERRDRFDEIFPVLLLIAGCVFSAGRFAASDAGAGFAAAMSEGFPT